MKVGVVGAGKVGTACVFALIMRGAAREIVLVDRTRKRATAVATYMRYGAPLSGAVDIRDGDYGDLAGAGLVMITVGVNEKTGGATDRSDRSGRLRLLEHNAGIYRDIVPKVVAAAPQAVLLVVTDPPDPLADLTRRLARHERVLSTGTYLDSLRFRVHLARTLAIDPAFVEAQVLGEHGTSEVFVWSGARAAGVPILDAFAQQGLAPEQCRRDVERDVRYANITIIEGNDASRYGIGMVSARLAQMVLRDERALIPVGGYSAKYGVTLSLPWIIGREGGIRSVAPALSPEEGRLLDDSAEALKAAARQITD
jgi:L-lactate dehydrogenase